jgi:uncharacterized protein YaaQ
MKLIIAILHDEDSDNVAHALTTSGFKVTVVASTGGFLRRGQSTMLVGVEDEQLEKALQLIRDNVSKVPVPDGNRATIFVIKVDQYVHF